MISGVSFLGSKLKLTRLTCLPISGSLDNFCCILWKTAVASGQPLISVQVVYIKLRRVTLFSYILCKFIFSSRWLITGPSFAGEKLASV